jgi:tripartite-type tricarboxylate transporter receptor subunit TctC
LIREGRVRPIAVAGAVRDPTLPDVPTVAEQGFPGFAASTWFGLFAPARQSGDALARLSAEVPRAMADAELKARLASLSLTDPGLAGAAAADFVRREAQIWADVVRSSGATAD